MEAAAGFGRPGVLQNRSDRAEQSDPRRSREAPNHPSSRIRPSTRRRPPRKGRGKPRAALAARDARPRPAAQGPALLRVRPKRCPANGYLPLSEVRREHRAKPQAAPQPALRACPVWGRPAPDFGSGRYRRRETRVGVVGGTQRRRCGFPRPITADESTIWRAMNSGFQREASWRGPARPYSRP